MGLKPKTGLTWAKTTDGPTRVVIKLSDSNPTRVKSVSWPTWVVNGLFDLDSSRIGSTLPKNQKETDLGLKPKMGLTWAKIKKEWAHLGGYRVGTPNPTYTWRVWCGPFGPVIEKHDRHGLETQTWPTWAGYRDGWPGSNLRVSCVNLQRRSKANT